MVNGEARIQINPSRGLQQGDPLSPYLFVTVKDVLSKMIIKARDSNEICGIKLNRHCPQLSHIFFANDALLFLKAEVQNCDNIKAILKDYGIASRQRINFDKSGVFFSSNMCDNDKQLLSDFFDVPSMKGDAEYLGLPTSWGRLKSEAYSFIVEKTLGVLQGWKQKRMSMGGKEIMIKSVT